MQPNTERRLSRPYLLSLPERVIRSALGLSAGLLREVGEVILPRGLRSTQLYKSLVDVTLRYVIEQVGGAQGVYPAEHPQPHDFLVRRGAGNAIELLGIVAFRVSPVWVLAAMADLSGLGRRLIPEIADALKAQGLLENETQFYSVDQLLDGLERTSARQGRSVFETSSALAIAAVRSLPRKARWLSASARVGATHTGKLLSTAILEHYHQTLGELREVGYLTYAKRQLSPYMRACVDLFSPQRRTLTQRLLDRVREANV